jgi:hypothetical protein
MQGMNPTVCRWVGLGQLFGALGLCRPVGWRIMKLLTGAYTSITWEDPARHYGMAGVHNGILLFLD